MKRFLTAILTVTMCLGLLTGCGKQTTINDTWDGTLPEWAQVGKIEDVGTRKVVGGEKEARNFSNVSAEIPTEWKEKDDGGSFYMYLSSENGVNAFVSDGGCYTSEEVCEDAITDRLRERQGSFVFAECFDVKGSNSSAKSYAFGYWDKDHETKNINLYIADFNNPDGDKEYFSINLHTWKEISWEDFRKEIDNYIVKVGE